MGGPEFAVADDVRSGSAEVTGVPGSSWVSAEELDFGADGELLVQPDCRRVLAVDHDSAIAIRPAGAILTLISGEAVLELEDVV